MRKLIIKKNGQEIHSVEEWFRLAPPEGGKKQWVPLHSAYEQGDYFTHYDGYVPKEIDDYLNDIGVDSSDLEAEPEAITSLYEDGFGKNGPRHHDSLLWNTGVAMGIEAKATETLDEYVTDKCKGNCSPNQRLRYHGLCKRILNKDIKECSNIRYQLLSATAGTLIEARNKTINKAALVVLLFESEITSKEHIENTRKDIEAFTSCLKVKSNGSFEVPFAPQIDFYVKFIVTKASSYKN